MFMNELADRLAATVRERRLDLGLTQQQAATKAGLSLPTWQAIEGAQRDDIRERTARGVCHALEGSKDSVARILRGEQPTVEMPDVVADELQRLRDQITEAEERLRKLEQRYRQ